MGGDHPNGRAHDGNPVWTYKNDRTQCSNAAGSHQLTDSAPCAVAPEHSGASSIAPGAIVITADH
jgi:hypothetical protein